MLAPFFLALRGAGIPVSLTEYLMLLEALDARLAGYGVSPRSSERTSRAQRCC
jgi:uncharacterized protein with von Willebrand factor type A (vWA) domain